MPGRRLAPGVHLTGMAGFAAGRVAAGRLGRDGLALNDVAAAALGRALVRPLVAARAAAAAGAAIRLGLGIAMGALLLVDQRLPVGDRDLVVVGMDFAEGEKAV